MNVPMARFSPILSLLVCGLLLALPARMPAESHVVSTAQLRQTVNATAQARQAQVSKVETFFSSPRVEKTLRAAHLDPVQIRTAIPQLSDLELARLSSQTDKIQRDFAAGSLTNQQITYILIAVGTALLVTIIFVAK
jgi:hypothetical protein